MIYADPGAMIFPESATVVSLMLAAWIFDMDVPEPFCCVGRHSDQRFANFQVPPWQTGMLWILSECRHQSLFAPIFRSVANTLISLNREPNVACLHLKSGHPDCILETLRGDLISRFTI